MIVRKFSKTLSGFRGTVARVSAAVLVVGLLSAGLASAWLPPSAALAASGGNGKGNGKGGANGNGGNSGAHDNNGNGAGSGSDSSDADQDAAAASEGGAVTAEHGSHDFVADEVVVANLGEDARTDVAQLGFVVLDEQQLASLGL